MQSAVIGVNNLNASVFDNGHKFIDFYPESTSITVESKRIKISAGDKNISASGEENLMALKSDVKKIYVPMENAYYHLMVDSFSSIANQAKANPGAIFIITTDVFNGSSSIIDKFFAGLNRMYGVSYLLLDPGNYEVNNIVITTPKNLSMVSGMYSNDVYLAFSDDNSLAMTPYRKVYVSRGAINDHTVDVIDYKTRNINHRISDEPALESFFRDLGFEIVYAETLTIEEKIKIFAETKVLVSVTSAGLANAIFMKPGTMMIELLVPIIWGARIELYPNLYNKIAAFKSMTYLFISSINNSAQEILSQLNNYRNLIFESGKVK